jgi:O-antigen biosynthesis protein
MLSKALPAKTLLVIGYVWPEPNSSAAGCHMLSLLKLFKRQGYRVVFATPAQKTEHMIDLTALDIEAIEISLNDPSFDLFAQQLLPDVVLFDRFMMEEQFAWRIEKACPQAMRILDTEDLQCLRGARQQALKDKRNLQLNDLYSDLAKREIAAILRSDLSLIISDFELELLQKRFNVEPSLLHHLPFMLNDNPPIPQLKSFTQRQHFIAIGNFRHAPNWDSVLYLQSIWPHIRKKLPNAELHIYGAYPPKKATQLNNPKSGFLIKGWAENAFEVLGNARVCLAPLRFGAGIKGKLIDAMQVATPSITTPIGAEGMTGQLPWPGIVVETSDGSTDVSDSQSLYKKPVKCPEENQPDDSAELIAKAAIELYQNESLWLQAQANIQPILQTRYNAEQLGNQLIKKVDAIKHNLEQHRLNNFTGAMLNHHSMKSTQYMSQWIEAKNKLVDPR